jgi:hypothetical protein
MVDDRAYQGVQDRKNIPYFTLQPKAPDPFSISPDLLRRKRNQVEFWGTYGILMETGEFFGGWGQDRSGVNDDERKG